MHDIPRLEDRPSTRHDREKVQGKLKKAFPEMAGADVEKLTLRLTDAHALISHHFPHLLKRGADALDTAFQEAKAYGKKGFSTRKERDECSKRLLLDQQAAHNVRVSLKLYELKGEHKQRVAKAVSGLFPKGHFDYGPYHAAIQVGDVVLDWNADSLVIPHIATPEASAASSSPAQLVLEASVSSASAHRTKTQIANTAVWGTQVETMHGFIQEANFTIDLIAHNELLIHQLADAVVLYNTKYEYDILTLNCQHFVTEVLEAMGGEEHVRELKQRTEQIRNVMQTFSSKGAQCPQYDLSTHATLDEYVRINIEGMTKEDLNLCHCRYILFHTLGTVQSKQAWHCDANTCQHKEIEQRL